MPQMSTLNSYIVGFILASIDAAVRKTMAGGLPIHLQNKNFLLETLFVHSITVIIADVNLIFIIIDEHNSLH